MYYAACKVEYQYQYSISRTLGRADELNHFIKSNYLWYMYLVYIYYRRGSEIYHVRVPTMMVWYMIHVMQTRRKKNGINHRHPAAIMLAIRQHNTQHGA